MPQQLEAKCMKRSEGLPTEGPLPKEKGWTNYINGIQAEGERQSVRNSLTRETRFEADALQKKTARYLSRESSPRPRSRPKK